MNRDDDGKESLGHYEPTPLDDDRERADWAGLAGAFVKWLALWIVFAAAVFGVGYIFGTRF